MFLQAQFLSLYKLPDVSENKVRILRYCELRLNGQISVPFNKEFYQTQFNLLYK